MEGIKIWIKSLTGFIFICAVIEALIPETSLKKTVRMILGVVMSILIISPFTGISIDETDIFADSAEYINYDTTYPQMQELTENQSRRLYEQSVNAVVKRVLGEDVSSEVIITDETKTPEIIIHKNVPEKKAELAAALGVEPAEIQMTE